MTALSLHLRRRHLLTKFSITEDALHYGIRRYNHNKYYQSITNTYRLVCRLAYGNERQMPKAAYAVQSGNQRHDNR